MKGMVYAYLCMLNKIKILHIFHKNLFDPVDDASSADIWTVYLSKTPGKGNWTEPRSIGCLCKVNNTGVSNFNGISCQNGGAKQVPENKPKQAVTLAGTTFSILAWISTSVYQTSIIEDSLTLEMWWCGLLILLFSMGPYEARHTNALLQRDEILFEGERRCCGCAARHVPYSVTACDSRPPLTPTQLPPGWLTRSTHDDKITYKIKISRQSKNRITSIFCKTNNPKHSKKARCLNT